MREVVEMAQTLLKMSTDTYMCCKYILLLSSKEDKEVNAFFTTLFNLTDKYRPLHIGMRGGV